MTPGAHTLITTVADALTAHETRFQQLDDSTITFRFGLEAGTYTLFLVANEERGLLTCYAYVGVHVPADRRAAVAEAMARINPRLAVGHLELDFADGEISFRACIDVEGGLLGVTMVDNLVRAGFYALERYLPALMRVAYGDATPEDAVEGVELAHA